MTNASEAVGVLVSDRFPADLAQRCEGYAERIGRKLAWIPIPADPQARVPDDVLPSIQVAF